MENEGGYLVPLYIDIRNPDRKWWQLWRHKKVKYPVKDKLIEYMTVYHQAPNPVKDKLIRLLAAQGKVVVK